jgi:hypothetical protein
MRSISVISSNKIGNWRMNLRCLLSALLILSTMNGTQAATNNGNTGGLLGADLNRARLQADYFRFFNLEPIGPVQALENGEQLLAFKPSGAAFRDLVTIYVQTDPQGLISMLRVVIARSFLDDPRNGVYARDLVKSSLLDCLNETDAGNLKELADEIQFRDVKGTLLIRSEVPTLPATPSAAYLVVNGTTSAWETTFSSSKIKLTNETEENRPALVIEIRTQ